MELHTVGTPGLWAAFTVLVLSLLALDLGVFHRKEHAIGVREALGWTAFWVALALLFNAGVYVYFGAQRGLEFFTGYVIEEALSVDNLFVFLVILSYFKVPKQHQHRVLFWGIIGALVMRALFIVAGAALLQSFHWAMYVFGAFLVFTGIKLLRGSGDESHPERNPIVRFFQRVVPSVSDYREGRFFVREGGRLLATPLVVVIVAIELTDVLFALDSIPAIFGVTTNPFVVYTSNVFAILGLRSMFFALSGLMGHFRYLNVGLAFVLSFIGAKMLAADLVHIPVAVSLAVVAALLGGAIIASLIPKENEESASLAATTDDHAA